MKKFSFYLVALLALSAAFTSCKKDEPDPVPPVQGCMDPNSMNYNPLAEEDDGSCTYADKFFPLAVGNEWHLSDSISIPLVGGATVYADFSMYGDTVVDGQTWYLMHETVSTATFGTLSDLYYMYRQANTGEVYRIELGDSVTHLFLEYPLELGASWYDTDTQDGFFCEVFSKSILTVPAGTFSNCAGIHFTDLANSTLQDLYFAKDGGLIRVDVTFDALGTPVNAQMELDSYTVQ